MYYYYSLPFLILCIAISLVAEVLVKTAFNKYSAIPASRGMTAADVARLILDRNHLQHIRIEYVSGQLSDHFDPRQNVIRLSESVYHSTSIAAIGVAAHECGHAIQYAEEYKPIVFRNAIVRSTNFCARISYILIFIGVLISYASVAFSSVASLIITLGIIAFSATTFFQLVTLPVEFNASRRALAAIEDYRVLTEQEAIGAKKVLSAAAMTYVAALVVSLLQLLRLIVRFRGNKR